MTWLVPWASEASHRPCATSSRQSARRTRFVKDDRVAGGPKPCRLAEPPPTCLGQMQHHTTSRYLKHNSIVAARRTPWALVRQCRQHSCDIGQVTLYPISGGWVLRELTTGDGNNENAFANHVASVRGSPTCEACPRMEFLQEPSIRENFVSFVPAASTGGATAGHGPETCSLRTKHARPPSPLECFDKIHFHRLYRLGMFPRDPLRICGPR